MNMKWGSTGLVAGSMLVMAQQGVAAPSEYTLRVGADLRYHDNAALASEDEQSDVERVIRAQLGYRRPDDGLFLVDLDYLAEYSDFLHDEQESETAIDGRANFLWHMLPRNLDFVLHHQISQQLTDRRTTDVSDNRERRQVLTTGFDGKLHPSAVDTIVISPRFVDVKLQESDQSDSQRGGLNVAWQHQLSAVSLLALTAGYNDVKFDEGDNDYESSSLMLSYRAALSRLSYQLGAGYNKFDRDSGDSPDGYMLRLGADYQGEGFTWGGTLVHELTDNSIGLSGVELDMTNFRADDSNFEVQDIVERTQLDLFARRRLGVDTEIFAGIGARRDRYETDNSLDEDSYYMQLGYTYQLSSRWGLGATARWENIEFVDDPTGLEYDDTYIELFATYRVNSRLDWRVAVLREQRDSDIDFQEYTDNQAVLSVNYRFF